MDPVDRVGNLASPAAVGHWLDSERFLLMNVLGRSPLLHELCLSAVQACSLPAVQFWASVIARIQ